MAMLKEKNEALQHKVDLYREREQIVNETRAQIEDLTEREEQMKEQAQHFEKEVSQYLRMVHSKQTGTLKSVPRFLGYKWTTDFSDMMNGFFFVKILKNFIV